ncbi:hypothetical protein BCR44DRAFT_1460917 [Catenaria anguillulae PL171]|uniref:Secreted protein n=1 Tax=Catenaria anguillulae PL171 TaxID=765915 RepID=A0A1Y2HP17_9FUNG|nr:hypothetical protein BCR44DRAFT_1460917 [Catenaria anguillulae PL171]
MISCCALLPSRLLLPTCARAAALARASPTPFLPSSTLIMPLLNTTATRSLGPPAAAPCHAVTCVTSSRSACLRVYAWMRFTHSPATWSQMRTQPVVAAEISMVALMCRAVMGNRWPESVSVGVSVPLRDLIRRRRFGYLLGCGIRRGGGCSVRDASNNGWRVRSVYTHDN